MFKVDIIGNLGADAVAEARDGREFVRFRVAHTERFIAQNGLKSEITTWFSCIMSGNGGDLLQYLKKGQKVYVSGYGTLKIYSSAKERRLMAGADISVRSVELCGSGAADAVPPTIYDEQGVGHDVVKLFTTRDGLRSCYVVNDRMEQYYIDDNGWIVPVAPQPSPTPSQPDATTTTTEEWPDGKPFTGEEQADQQLVEPDKPRKNKK